MNTILNKVNATTLTTLATAIISTLAAFGQVPHSSGIIQVAGVAGTLVASLVMVWHAKPATTAQAVHTFIQNVAANATTEQKTALVQAYTNFIDPPATQPASTATVAPAVKAA